MLFRTWFRVSSFVVLVVCFALSLVGGRSEAQDDPAAADVRKANESLVKAFNAANADELAAQFLPKGELVDEEGTIYQGKQELTEAFKSFFAKFPGAKLTMSIDSVRSLSPNLVVEEGLRVITAGKDLEERAQLRFVAVRTKGADGRWLIASLREFSDDPLPTPNERLQGLAWLVGDWVNEGSDGKVRISFRWSDDKNFLLGDYHIEAKGKAGMKSSQRLGWDPLAGRVRSWLFDADGGFSEGAWTPTEDGWMVKSNSINPDGATGSATLIITSQGADRFTIKGTHRIVAEQAEPDFEFVITRRPPAAGK